MAVHIQPFVVISSNAYAREHAPVGPPACRHGYTEQSPLLEDGEVSPRGRSRYRSEYGSSRSTNSSLRTLRPTPVHSPRAGEVEPLYAFEPPRVPSPTHAPQATSPGRWARLRAILAQLLCLPSSAEPHAE